jgi:hypothetical protein
MNKRWLIVAVPDLIHPRHGHPGRFGKLLARDALLE